MNYDEEELKSMEADPERNQTQSLPLPPPVNVTQARLNEPAIDLEPTRNWCMFYLIEQSHRSWG